MLEPAQTILILQQQPDPLTLIATTNGKLAALNQHRFLFAIQNTPMFAIEVMRSYSNRLRQFKRLVSDQNATKS
ncbi:MAG: hypothetical protein WA902_08005 [Thermosynechococcaceae cyanobacterium]